MNSQVRSWKGEIAGGWARISVSELGAIWGRYQSGALRAFDLRVWLAAHEMRMRREVVSREKVRAPSYQMKELQVLLGREVSEARLRAALRRLERAEALWMRRGSIRFGEVTNATNAGETGEIDVLVA